jgi:hypothetical protein
MEADPAVGSGNVDNAHVDDDTDEDHAQVVQVRSLCTKIVGGVGVDAVCAVVVGEGYGMRMGKVLVRNGVAVAADVVEPAVGGGTGSGDLDGKSRYADAQLQ